MPEFYIKRPEKICYRFFLGGRTCPPVSYAYGGIEKLAMGVKYLLSVSFTCGYCSMWHCQASYPLVLERVPLDSLSYMYHVVHQKFVFGRYKSCWRGIG